MTDKPKILVVSDNKSWSENCAYYFGEDGYEIIPADLQKRDARDPGNHNLHWIQVLEHCKANNIPLAGVIVRDGSLKQNNVLTSGAHKEWLQLEKLLNDSTAFEVYLETRLKGAGDLRIGANSDNTELLPARITKLLEDMKTVDPAIRDMVREELVKRKELVEEVMLKNAPTEEAIHFFEAFRAEDSPYKNTIAAVDAIYPDREQEFAEAGVNIVSTSDALFGHTGIHQLAETLKNPATHIDTTDKDHTGHATNRGEAGLGT